jgi:hypothetical protein
MALLALMFPSGAALIAVGQARYALYANIAGLIATVVFVICIRPATPWEAVLVWCGVQVLIGPYSLWANARALGFGLLRPLRAGVPALLVSAVGVAAAFAMDAGEPLEALIRRVVVFGVVVVACAVPLFWWRRAVWFPAGGSGVMATESLRRETTGLPRRFAPREWLRSRFT